MTRPAQAWSADSTLAFALHGYEFISRRCDRFGSDIFQTRLLGERTVAMPGRVQKTLLGVGGVQGLDGEAHHHRKQLFMSLMSPPSIRTLSDLVASRWRERIHAWEQARRVVLFDEIGQILCQAVSQWAGIPTSQSQVPGRTAQLHAMIDGPAAAGPRYWQGKAARRRAERGLGILIERVRTGTVPAPDGSPLRAVADYREPGGQLLDTRVAAVELLNLLRPTVAVDLYIIFTALALHEHPQWRTRLRAGGEQDAELFAQEVRRFYPFFPVVAARVRSAFYWQGLHFPGRPQGAARPVRDQPSSPALGCAGGVPSRPLSQLDR